MLVGSRGRGQQPAQKQPDLVPVREPETRSVLTGLPERRISNQQPRRCWISDDNEESPHHERPPADGRLQFESGQFKSSSVILKPKNIGGSIRYSNHLFAFSLSMN